MKTDYFDKAAQQFANLMIEKIQQVEDNWQDVYKRQVNSNTAAIDISTNTPMLNLSLIHI